MSVLSELQQKLPAAPKAAQKSHIVTAHGQSWEDPWFWIRDPKYPEVDDREVLSLLEAENSYHDAVMKPIGGQTERLFDEFKGRIKQDDQSVPIQDGEYEYFWRFEKGQEYRQWLRRPLGADSDELLLDENQLAEGQEFLVIGSVETSHDHRYLAWTRDHDGAERYVVHFRDLETGEELSHRIENCDGSIVWSPRGLWLFYMELDDNHRPVRCYRFDIKTGQRDLVFEETNPTRWVWMSHGQRNRYMQIVSADKETTAVTAIDVTDPTAESFELFPAVERRQIHAAFHGDMIYFLTNDTHRNFRLVKTDFRHREENQWQEVIPANDAAYLDDMAVFKDFIAVRIKRDGLAHMRLLALNSNMESHDIHFPDPVWTVSFHVNIDFDQNYLRLAYSSPVTPNTVFKYDPMGRKLDVLKVQEIPSGYERDDYVCERLFLTMRDGIKAPATVLRHKDVPLDSSAPMFLYAYGSYGHAIPPNFAATRLSLLDRGFVYAIAHVRGGDDMGYHWYDDGKLDKKANTFNDYIDIAEGLIEKGYSKIGAITVCGRSAGGYLVGNVINQRPDLFKAAIAGVPFVDIVNTMLDGSLPLTPTEYTEWGNPEIDQKVFELLMELSPYDNVTEKPYPHLYVSAGLTDPRVTYWEPAKWVAKIRASKNDDNLLVLKTNMDAGHFGQSGRFEALQELAEEYAFLLMVYDRLDHDV